MTITHQKKSVMKLEIDFFNVGNCFVECLERTGQSIMKTKKLVTGIMAAAILAASPVSLLAKEGSSSVQIITEAVPEEAKAMARSAMENYLSFYIKNPNTANISQTLKKIALGNGFALYNKEADGQLSSDRFYYFPVYYEDEVLFLVDIFWSDGQWHSNGEETPAWLKDLEGKPGCYQIYVSRGTAVTVPQTAQKLDPAEVDPSLAAAQVYPSLAQPNASLYRLYNPNNGEHFYTEDYLEKESLRKNGWKDEGTGWVSPLDGQAVYRLYNPNSGEHHYTQDGNERTVLIQRGWKDEGTGFYSDLGKEIPVYRLFNPNAKDAGSHMYTTSKAEAAALEKRGWHFEGIGWYAELEGCPAN